MLVEYDFKTRTFILSSGTIRRTSLTASHALELMDAPLDNGTAILAIAKRAAELREKRRSPRDEGSHGAA